MAFSWNDEQKKAIGLRDASLLVSAAAGSGKTTVMVERILTMLTDKENPIDIDRLLVVTFTRAAASSMREKILNAIRERCDKEPDNEHLRRQLTLVGHTQITTIDSFCLHIVRNHFHAAGIEPGFRIGEEGELALLKQDVSEAVMEQFYQEKDPVFLALTESYGSAKSDDAVREMMLALYERAQSGPDPSGWLDNCLSCYPDPSDETISEWLSEYLDAVYFPEIRELAAEWEAYADLLKAPDAPGHYRSAILQDLAFLENLSSASDYDTIREILIGFQPEKLKGSSKFDGDKALQQRIKDRRDLLKKRVESFRKDTFCDPLEIQLKRLGETKPAARELIRLSECFLRSFAKEKEKRKLVDFNDIEHFALRILRDEKGKPTQTALEYRSHFYEVMIDEYQDSNYLQEAILTAVAPIVNGVPRLFMVGDVKQSIYRFRQARPELFMGKYASFSYEDSPQRKIDLFYNYRSRHEVIDTVNRIFSGLMRTDHCGIEYDEAARLHQGADESEDPQADYATEVWLLASDSGREDLLKETAQLIAAEIERLVNGEAIQGLRYKDIAILLRSFSDAPAIFQRAFQQKGSL